MDESKQTEKESVKMLSISTLDLLKCSKCKQYLSCSPVYSFEDETNLCKTCYDTESSEFKKMNHVCNSLYVNIAKELYFPCQYSREGCTETIGFGRSNHHCVYGMLFDCPVVEDGFRGSVKGINDHLKSQHPDILFEQNEIAFSITKQYYNAQRKSYRLFIKFTQPDRSLVCYCNYNYDIPRKCTKVIVNAQGRMLLVGVDIFSVCDFEHLRVDVAEFTYKERCEKCTLTFKQGPDLYLTKKHEITSKGFSSNTKFCEQSLDKIFDLFGCLKIFCTISFDVPNDTDVLLEEDAADNNIST